MQRRALGIALLVGLVAGACRPAAAQRAASAAPGSLALVGGTLIDGTGAAPLRNSVVLIRDQRIEQVGSVESLQVPAGYQQISTEGMTVLPGLWDLHVHLVYAGHPGNFRAWFENHRSEFDTVTMPSSAERLLMAGVTSARDLGAPESILQIKRRITAGQISGPTVYVAGPLLTHGPFEGPATALTPDEVMTHLLGIKDVGDARAQTRRLIDAGVDVIKVISADKWSLDELKAVVEEAHAGGRKVAAHAFTEEEVRQGIAAGVDDFQHVPMSAVRSGFSAELLAAIRDRVQQGPTLFWTITVGERIGSIDPPDPEFLDDPANFRGLPPPMVDEIRKAQAARTAATQPLTVAAVKRAVTQLQEAGVELVFGTDTGAFRAMGVPAQWADADIWVRHLGLEPMMVIRRMTSDAARLMGVGNDYGTVRKGFYADVIAVRGDPLRHMNVLRDPPIVIKHGRRYK